MEFFTEWYVNLSAGDTVLLFVVVGFMIVCKLRFGGQVRRKRKKDRRKAAKKAQTAAKTGQLNNATGVMKTASSAVRPLVDASSKINIPKDL